MLKRIFLSVLGLFLWGCGGKSAVESVSQLTDEFVHTALSLTPVAATSAGYHQHKGVTLDELLDDYSQPGVEAAAKFFGEFQKKLSALNPEQLAPEDRADYDILKGQVALNLLDLETIQSHKHNPTVYVELIGNALFAPYTLEYAPIEQRYRHIIARLGKIPALVEQAKNNLADAPEIWNTVAQSENEGNIGLVDKTLREGAPAGLRTDYERAARPALAALQQFDEYLKNDLVRRTSDWRLGKDRYATKFRLSLGTDRPVEDVLVGAEDDIKTVRKQMADLALPLHLNMYPSHRHPVDLNLIVGEVLKRIADKHSTPDQYFADARRDLAETRQFVKDKNLLPLPPRDNLQVIDTPEFMRGIYAVGGFTPAPALEPQLGAFYWLTPIPKSWSEDRIDSKLREYNFYGLKLLTIHEAMPGHYVQFEYANDVQPHSRRLLRGVFGNGPYVEGWAVYATELMLDQDYLGASPELRLTFLKQVLRLLANAVIDIRLHTAGMTDQECLDLMTQRTFQESEEATAKLQRAKLSSCQLPTYYVGWRGWQKIRKSATLPLAEFHKRALAEGAVPLPVLERLLR